MSEAAGLSDLGKSIEKMLKLLMTERRFSALDFQEQMLVLDKALKLESIKQRAAAEEEGAWFRSIERDTARPPGEPNDEDEDDEGEEDVPRAPAKRGPGRPPKANGGVE